MKLRQNARHIASRAALEVPFVGSAVRGWLVDLHVDVFLDRAPEPRREERREHLDAFFEDSMDMYLAALRERHTEAEAREITHVVANFDFYNHGWTEMMEFPPAELDDHYGRHADFFERHGVTMDDPLGEFAPDGGLPDAPATPAKLDPEHAEPGYADDVYVDRDGEAVPAGETETPDADPTDAPTVEADET
jgi:hypothetical protein